MCNSHSQRWLVKDQSNPTTAFVLTMPRSEIAVCLHCIKKYTTAAQADAPTVQTTMMARSRSRVRTSTATGVGVHSPSCVNQIIEVLLAILLVNFLANTLVACVPAAAALSGTRNRESIRSSSGSRKSLSSSSSGDGAYANYHQPHRNGDMRSATSGYNSLPHQQHQFVDNENFQSALSNHLQQRSQNFKISPKPCSIGRIEGTCMFVWECIKSEGQHVGMCVDSFMFGSCCAHNYTDNIVLPQTFSYTRPTKPVGISSLNHRPRPPHSPHRPGISGMTTIERPHGAGTLVIRPSGPHHQGALAKPQYHIKPPSSSNILDIEGTTARTTSTEDPSLLWTSNTMFSDLQSVASVPSSFATTDMWYSSSSSTLPSSHDTTAASLPAQQHWHLTTEPNFITKPRPPGWEKPSLHNTKPSKPTKRPPPFLSLPQHSGHQQQTLPSSAVVYSTRNPMPVSMKPTRPAQLPHRPNPTKTAATTLSIITNTTMQPPYLYSPPSSSGSVSESSLQPTFPTTISVTTSTTRTTTTPQKYRPTATFLQSVTFAATEAINRPTPFTIATTSTTHHPTLDASTAITTGSQIPVFSHNLTSIESNEIGYAASEPGASIKTISAARSECGIPVLARPETRIVGGKSAAFGRWPWQVSVRRTSFFGFSSTHRCGGALINEKWIATAGHCVDDLLISQIRIRVGEYDFSHVQEQLPYIERGVAKKVVHPKYNFFTYEYDLALVKLEQPLEFAPHVSPICLPQTDSLLIGMNATVTGWGRLTEGGTLPSVLQEVSVPIVSNDNCKTMFLRAGRQEFIPEIFLCAGYETGGQDSCQGDSGGPLQVKSEDGHFFLAGIISWGIGCAEANLPGVCTRISKFVPWIMENVT